MPIELRREPGDEGDGARDDVTIELVSTEGEPGRIRWYRGDDSSVEAVPVRRMPGSTPNSVVAVFDRAEGPEVFHAEARVNGLDTTTGPIQIIGFKPASEHVAVQGADRATPDANPAAAADAASAADAPLQRSAAIEPERGAAGAPSGSPRHAGEPVGGADAPSTALVARTPESEAGPDTASDSATPRTGPSTPPATDAEDGVNEVSIGQFDAAFSYVTLVLVVLLIGGVFTGAWFVVQPFLGGLSASQAADFAPRARFVVDVAVLAVGAAVILLGAWLAGLETRGRLRAHFALGSGGDRHGDGPFSPRTAPAPDVLDKLPGILDKARRLRGAIAVVLAGTALVLCALWSISTIG